MPNLSQTSKLPLWALGACASIVGTLVVAMPSSPLLVAALLDPTTAAWFLAPTAGVALASYLVLTALFRSSRQGSISNRAIGAALGGAVIGIAALGMETISPLDILIVSLLVACGCAVAFADRVVSRRDTTLLLLGFMALVLQGFCFDWLSRYGLRNDVVENPRFYAAVFAVVTVATAASCVWLLRRGPVLVGVILLSSLIAGQPIARAWNRRPAQSVAGAPQGLPPVILVTIDTLRADSLSFMSDAAPPTPAIDRLAAESVVFQDAVSAASWTLPATVSMLTGHSPLAHGAGVDIAHAPVKSLAAHLSDAGYETKAIVCNPILGPSGAALDRYGGDKIDPVDDFLVGFDDVEAYHHLKTGGNWSSMWLLRLRPTVSWVGGATEQAIESATSFISRNRPRPYFLWLHIFDPHDPYAPSVEFLPKDQSRDGVALLTISDRLTDEDRDWYRAMYHGEVRLVDHLLGKFFDDLRGNGAYDDALIVLSSDHGEEFGDHGRMLHGHSMHNELLHAPLLFKLPGRNSGRTVEDLVATQSIAPTVLDFVGIEPDSRTGMAATLRGCIDGESACHAGEPVISFGTYYEEDQEAVTTPDWKYTRRLASGIERLYDRRADRFEHEPVGGEHEFVIRARELLEQARAEALEIRGRYGIESASEAEPSQERLRRLKSLGYL